MSMTEKQISLMLDRRFVDCQISDKALEGDLLFEVFRVLEYVSQTSARPELTERCGDLVVWEDTTELIEDVVDEINKFMPMGFEFKKTGYALDAEEESATHSYRVVAL